MYKIFLKTRIVTEKNVSIFEKLLRNSNILLETMKKSAKLLFDINPSIN